MHIAKNPEMTLKVNSDVAHASQGQRSPQTVSAKSATSARANLSSRQACDACCQPLYQFEKISVDGRSFHPSCFRCTSCKRLLNLKTYGTQFWELVDAPTGLDHNLAVEGVYRSVVYCQKHVPATTAGALKSGAALMLPYPVVPSQVDDLVPLAKVAELKPAQKIKSRQSPDVNDVRRKPFVKESTQASKTNVTLERSMTQRVSSTTVLEAIQRTPDSKRPNKLKRRPKTGDGATTTSSRNSMDSMESANGTNGGLDQQVPLQQRFSIAQAPVSQIQAAEQSASSLTEEAPEAVNPQQKTHDSLPETPQAFQKLQAISVPSQVDTLVGQSLESDSDHASSVSTGRALQHSNALSAHRELKKKASQSSRPVIVSLSPIELAESPSERYRQLGWALSIFSSAEESRRKMMAIQSASEVEQYILDTVTYTCKEWSHVYRQLVIQIAMQIEYDATAYEKAALRFDVFCTETATWLRERLAINSQAQQASSQRQMEKLKTFLKVFQLSAGHIMVEYANVFRLNLAEKANGWKVESVSPSLMQYCERIKTINEENWIDQLLDGQAVKLQQTKSVELLSDSNQALDGPTTAPGMVSLKGKRKKEKKKERESIEDAVSLCQYLNEQYGVHLYEDENVNVFSSMLSMESVKSISDMNDDKLNGLFMDRFDITTRTYRNLFCEREHRNYFGSSDKFGDVILSIKREQAHNKSPVYSLEQKTKGNAQDMFGFRILMRLHGVPNRLLHLFVTDRKLVEDGSNKGFFASGPFNQPPPASSDLADITEKIWKSLVGMLIPKMDYGKLKKVDVRDGHQISKLEKSLIQVDEHRTSFNYKFGLLYVKDGQVSEQEWFNNTVDHQANNNDPLSFTTFCETIGEMIELKGHTGFSAGLDTKNGNTGERSVHTRWCYDLKSGTAYDAEANETKPNTAHEFEVMYHVSTLLPLIENDEQQIQRKRHIGNDLVSLVFIDQQDGEMDLTISTPFDPAKIKSQFLHVYVVVQAVKWPVYPISAFTTENGSLKNVSMVPGYRVSVVSVGDVPSFSPFLPDQSVFLVANAKDRQTFKNFLLAKLINGENAAYEASKFKSLQARTYCSLVESLVKQQTLLSGPSETKLYKLTGSQEINYNKKEQIAKDGNQKLPSKEGTEGSEYSTTSSKEVLGGGVFKNIRSALSNSTPSRGQRVKGMNWSSSEQIGQFDQSSGARKQAVS